MGFCMVQDQAPDRRVSKTRKAIKTALVELILEKDSPKMTITEIAKRADIDRKTFYLHYDSVNDVVRDFSKEKLTELRERLKDSNFYDDAFDIDFLFKALNVAISDNIDLYRHIAKNPGYSSFWEETKSVVEESMLENVLSQIDASPQELSLYAEYFSSGIMAIYTKWLRNELDLSQEQLARSVATLSYYGLHGLLPATQVQDQ